MTIDNCERSSTPEIIMIMAMADNGIIGDDGKLPWHLPADLKHFKAITKGSPMVMGAKHLIVCRVYCREDAILF